MIEKDNLVIKEGDKFYYWDRELCHVVSFFDDCNRSYVILKSWNKYKNRWSYEINSFNQIYWWLTDEKHRQVKEVNGKLYIKANNKVL